MRWAWLGHPGVVVHCTSGSSVWQRMHLAGGVVSSVAYPSSVSVNLERMVSIVSCSWRRVTLPRRVVRAVTIIVLEWRSACCVVSNSVKTSTHWQSTCVREFANSSTCDVSGSRRYVCPLTDVGCSHLPLTRMRQMGSMLGKSSLTAQFSLPSSSILEERTVKKRFFRGDRNTSGCVIVGMVTTVPGRKVERRDGMVGVMGETGCLSVLVPGTQHAV
mgnify:FL=1